MEQQSNNSNNNVAWSISHSPERGRWAAKQAKAILAVDNIKPTQEWEELAQRVENGEISYEEAIQALVNRAHEYAKR